MAVGTDRLGLALRVPAGVTGVERQAAKYTEGSRAHGMEQQDGPGGGSGPLDKKSFKHPVTVVAYSERGTLARGQGIGASEGLL